MPKKHKRDKGLTNQAVLAVTEPSQNWNDRIGALLGTARWAILRAVQTASCGMRARRKTKRLELCDTVSLGDKRFIAVIQFEGERFLVGGAAQSVSMLARLSSSTAAPDFAAVLGHCESQALTIQ